MKKLVCESLQEYNNVNEASDDKHGPIKGTYRAIKSAPGRILRKKRARNVMLKYKTKILKKFNALTEKFLPRIRETVEHATNAINNIDPENDSNIQAQQQQSILDDFTKNLQNILTSLNNSLSEQLKVFADSLHLRLERAGTITGVEFTPENKTTLLSEWKIIESELQSEILKIFTNLIDDPFITKHAEVEAKIKQFVDKFGRYSSSSPIKHDVASDIDSLQSSEAELADIITDENIMNIKEQPVYFDQIYAINNPGQWNPQIMGFKIPTTASYLAFKTDAQKVGYIFYDRNKTKITNNVIFLIKPKEELKDAKVKLGIIAKILN